jgi:hypothetical protein
MEDQFIAHAALIFRQDGCTVGEARFRAWSEGPDGYAKRLAGYGKGEGLEIQLFPMVTHE